MDGEQYAGACDRFSRLRDNVRTVGLYVRKKRKMEQRPVVTGESELANAAAVGRRVGRWPMTEFVPASRLYHVESRTPTAHLAEQATGEQIRRALERREFAQSENSTRNGGVPRVDRRESRDGRSGNRSPAFEGI